MSSDNLQLPCVNLQLPRVNAQLPYITFNFLMVAIVIMIATVMVVMLVMVVRTGQDRTEQDSVLFQSMMML